MKAAVQTNAWIGALDSKVWVCSIGARTAVGLSSAATATAVRGAISGIALHPKFIDRDDEPVCFASDPLLDVDVPLIDRSLTLIRSAAAEASLPLLSKGGIVDRIYVALPEARSGLPADFESAMVRRLDAEVWLPSRNIVVSSRGHAGGLIAMQAAAQALERGEIGVALVLAVDSYHHPLSLSSLDLHRRLMSARNPGGFPPGEGAGACLLANSGSLARYGLKPLAWVRAACTAIEPSPLRSAEPCTGQGLTAVIAAVARDTARHGDVISATYCDLNGERYRSEEFLYSLMRTQEAFANAHDYVAPADCWGDVGAASGPLLMSLAVEVGRTEPARGRTPLLWASSDRGDRAAITFALE